MKRKVRLNQKIIMACSLLSPKKMKEVLTMPSIDAQKLEELLRSKGVVPADFIKDDSRADYLFLIKLLKKDTAFSRTNLSRLSELLGINAFELFRSGGTIVHGDSNITATNGSKIRIDAMEQELKKLKKDYKELQKKYISLLEKLADP